MSAHSLQHFSRPNSDTASRVLLNRRALLRGAAVLASELAVIAPSMWTGALAATQSGADVQPSGSGRPDASGARPVALVANSLSNTLTIVDARTFEPFRTMPVGREPHKFHLSQGGRTVYSCNTMSNEMIEIDLATLRPVRRIPTLDPYNVTFTTGRRLFALNYRYAFVDVHDARTFRRIRRLHTGQSPSHYALSPDGRWFVNSNQRANTVTVIDTDSLRVVRLISVDPFPAGVSISRDGRHMIVSSGHAGTLSVFATEDWRLIRRVHSGRDTHEHVATGNGAHIFVTNRGENTVSVFDVAAQRVIEKFHVPGGPDMPMLSADGRYLWVSGRYADIGTVIDARALRIVRTFRTQHSPHGVFLGTTLA